MPHLRKHEFLIKKSRLLISKTTCKTSFLHPNIEEKAVVQPQFYMGTLFKVLLHPGKRILTTHFS